MWDTVPTLKNVSGKVFIILDLSLDSLFDYKPTSFKLSAVLDKYMIVGLEE